MTSHPPTGDGLRLRKVAVVVFVAASGAVETVSFLGLGHVFAGVITGNLALLGMALGRGGGAADARSAGLAVAGYAAGATAVAWLTRDRERRKRPAAGSRERAGDRWPRRVLGCLAGELALLGVVAGVWAASAGAPGADVRPVLQCAAAVAMGGQSAAMAAAGRAAPTTYLTGTLTDYIMRGLGDESAGADRWVPARLAAMVAGAASAAAVRWAAPAWTAAVPLALAVLATLIGSGAASGLVRGARGTVAEQRPG